MKNLKKVLMGLVIVGVIAVVGVIGNFVATENKITVFENQNDLIKLDPSHTYQNRWMIQIR